MHVFLIYFHSFKDGWVRGLGGRGLKTMKGED